MEPCPVCNRLLPITELPEHVQLHFLEDEAADAAVPAASFAGGEYQEEAAGKIRCPLGCGELVLLQDLDSHEEAHRLQEMEAQHKSLQQEQEAAEFEKLQAKFGFSDKRPGKCFRCGEEGHWSRDCPSNPAAQAARARQPLTTDPAALVRIQQPDTVLQRHQQGVDVMALLQSCFQTQQKPRTTVYLSGPVTFCCRGPADAGWGCGYRNIQMQASHLLLTSPEHSRVLFGGAGFLPDLPALQAWLEVAWQAGFDPGGAAMFGAAVQCSRKWIGTTEAAALLRYFGCRALIVDFYGKTDHRDNPNQGPTIHQGVGCDMCGASPIIGARYQSYSTPDFDVCSSCSQSQQAQQHAPFHETGSAGRETHNNSNRLEPNPGALPAAAVTAATAAAATGPGPGRPPAGAAGRGGGGGWGRGKRKQPIADDRNQAANRHQALAEWIWAYFSSPGLQGSTAGPAVAHHAAAAAGPSSSSSSMHAAADSQPVNAFTRLQQRPTSVFMTGKPPLYFQHEGHSRTIVGIERSLPPHPQQQQQQPTAQSAGSSSGHNPAGGAEYTLIVLDPGMPQAELFSSLRNKDKWQMKVKRGMHSLARHSELQLLYVAPGIVPEGPERDAMKKVVAAERYR